MNKILEFFRHKKSQPAVSAMEDQQTQPIPSRGEKEGADLDLHCYPPQFTVGSGQSVGRSRDHNEDTIFHLATTFADYGTPQALGLFIVADGMGGHSHGELASKAATRAAVDYLLSTLFTETVLSGNSQPEKSLQELMAFAVQAAHLAVVKQAPGGGTTLTMAIAVNDQICLSHVGDSRAYLIEDDGKMKALTTDHSLVRRLVDLGQLTEEQSRTFPQKNVLYRALGQVEPLNPDLFSLTLPEHGKLMLCSDGLWGVVDQNEIFRLISGTTDLTMCCQKLVEAANQAGGPDNISVILVKLRQ